MLAHPTVTESHLHNPVCPVCHQSVDFASLPTEIAGQRSVDLPRCTGYNGCGCLSDADHSQQCRDLWEACEQSEFVDVDEESRGDDAVGFLSASRRKRTRTGTNHALQPAPIELQVPPPPSAQPGKAYPYSQPHPFPFPAQQTRHRREAHHRATSSSTRTETGQHRQGYSDVPHPVSRVDSGHRVLTSASLPTLHLPPHRSRRPASSGELHARYEARSGTGLPRHRGAGRYSGPSLRPGDHAFLPRQWSVPDLSAPQDGGRSGRAQLQPAVMSAPLFAPAEYTPSLTDHGHIRPGTASSDSSVLAAARVLASPLEFDASDTVQPQSAPTLSPTDTIPGRPRPLPQLSALRTSEEPPREREAFAVNGTSTEGAASRSFRLPGIATLLHASRNVP